jgi:acetyl-CoA carboxylase biotin carboxyl carrier protein
MASESDSNLPEIGYIRELAKVFKQYELDELEIETGDARMLLRRGDMPVVTAAGPAPAPANAPPAPGPPSAASGSAPAVKTDEGEFITSPFVGTFYRAPRPDAPNFTEVGARVEAGQTVCIVEAMKLFNEIEADYACTIEDVLVDNGQPVEYGAKLFRVRKS